MRSFLKSASAAVALAAIAGLAAPAHAFSGGNGWQAPFTYNVPTGLTDLFFHYPCPSGFYAQNGGFLVKNAATKGGGFTLTGSGPRLDLSPASYGEYAWNIEWPAGAPATSAITFNVLCKKGAP